jgi:hypothetical protein
MTDILEVAYQLRAIGERMDELADAIHTKRISKVRAKSQLAELNASLEALAEDDDSPLDAEMIDGLREIVDDVDRALERTL